MVDLVKLDEVRNELAPFGATLVAVSKTKPASDIRELMEHGQFVFGENYVQELSEKHEELGSVPQWHFIGSLQSNKVKMIVPYISMIHGVSSQSVLMEISKRSTQIGRTTNILLQVHIAKEESKSGFDSEEVLAFYESFLKTTLPGVSIRGLMGMATFTDDQSAVALEFRGLRTLFENMAGLSGPDFNTLSMGMSGDYKIALQEGSNMVRIGSLLFGSRS
ncbi:MAG: YggS family pyridoxal phosphate-dependent enzyme [Bacteroidota bacterium]